MSFSNADPGDYPPQNFKVDPYAFSGQDARGFISLVLRGAGERPIDLYLRERLPLLAYASKFFCTGHHGTWIIPQAHLRPPGASGRGLIPDYLFAGDNSDGVTWWIVELKISHPETLQQRQARKGD